MKHDKKNFEMYIADAIEFNSNQFHSYVNNENVFTCSIFPLAKKKYVNHANEQNFIASILTDEDYLSAQQERKEGAIKCILNVYST